MLEFLDDKPVKIQRTRTIRGHRYTWVIDTSTKALALIYKESLEKKGYIIRIVKKYSKVFGIEFEVWARR